MHLDAMHETGDVSTDEVAYWRSLLHIIEGEYDFALQVPKPSKFMRPRFEFLQALALAKQSQFDKASETVKAIDHRRFVSEFDKGLVYLAMDQSVDAVNLFDAVNSQYQRPLALEKSAEIFSKAGLHQAAGDCYALAVKHQPFVDYRLIVLASFAYRRAGDAEMAARFERLADAV